MISIRKNISDLKVSDTLEINELSNKLHSEGQSIYRFGFGQSPFPVPQIVQDELRRNAHQKNYLPVQGLHELRQQVANHSNQLLGQNLYQADNIFVGPGSKELIYLAQMALDAPLLLPNPSWVSYLPQAQIVGKQVCNIPTDKKTWNITSDILEEEIIRHGLSKGILLLNYPNNPTGQTFEDHELQSIAKVCRRHNIIVISDEIYGLLNFDGQYRSIARYYPEGTLVTTGLSKWCGAGGWRLGIMLIPDQLKYFYKSLRALASETFSAVSAPIQYAAVEAYRSHPEIEAYLDASRAILSMIAHYCYNELRQHDIEVLPSSGGFYLFPNFDTVIRRSTISSPEFCKKILTDYGVALLPGSAFGRPPNELTARLCYVDFDGERALDTYLKNDGIRTDQFKDIFPNIVAGMSQLSKLCEECKSQ
jgi:aspartate/methionine/tyrosine aminotransferase